MKGLLLKDVYTLFRQMKLYLLVLVVFSLIPDAQISCFAIVYCGLLPMTALAYDERSKWDQLAVMMPYSVKTLVLSKYVLGYLAIFCAAGLALLAQTAVGLFRHTGSFAGSLPSTVIILCAALFLLAFILPLVFRNGVEKARMTHIVVILLAVVIGVGAQDTLLPFFTGSRASLLPLMAVLLSAAANLISIPLSERFYRRRHHL